ncbi:MAG: DUF6329 domain-containing protein [Oscillospiraceae bacterium]|nr:DUF6329 domain-containing protein [Oscillospiraceae bacterium]
MELNAIFHRKQPEFEPQRCVVAKIVELCSADFQEFRSGMMHDWDFIAENIPLMGFDENGTRHCMLVLGEGCDDGILVDSQGYDYARYASFVPGARELLLMAQQMAELGFVNQIAQIEAANLDCADDWMSSARGLAQVDTNSDVESHLDYLRCLREFSDAFAEIDQQYEEVAAEIFNYKPGYLPTELLPAAHWICNGGTADEAYIKAQNGDFDLTEPTEQTAASAQAQGLDAGMIF